MDTRKNWTRGPLGRVGVQNGGSWKLLTRFALPQNSHSRSCGSCRVPYLHAWLVVALPTLAGPDLARFPFAAASSGLRKTCLAVGWGWFDNCGSWRNARRKRYRRAACFESHGSFVVFLSLVQLETSARVFFSSAFNPYVLAVDAVDEIALGPRPSICTRRWRAWARQSLAASMHLGLTRGTS